MLLILSPAKRINTNPYPGIKNYTRPALIDQSAKLVALLKSYSPDKLGSLLKISDQLAVINAGRYQEWSLAADPASAKQAFFAYDGDVYRGLNAGTLDDVQVEYSQEHIRILSGLYGILRPLDLIQPYRLEMGTKLPNPEGKDLYAFWSSVVTDAINKDLKKLELSTLVNLASDEYFRAIDLKGLKADVITPVFQEPYNGGWKIIPVHAKRARGLMARYAAVNRIDNEEQIKAFDSEGYAFDSAASDSRRWVFRRRYG